MFDAEAEFLRSVERDNDQTNRRELLSAADTLAMTETYRGIPEEYLAYLREIGSGSVREGQYFVHSGLGWCHEEPLFKWFASEGRRLLVFGSNSMGDLWAFDADRDYQVCELLHETMEVWPHDGTFRGFIREQMLLAPDGTDMREP